MTTFASLPRSIAEHPKVREHEQRRQRLVEQLTELRAERDQMLAKRASLCEQAVLALAVGDPTLNTDVSRRVHAAINAAADRLTEQAQKREQALTELDDEGRRIKTAVRAELRVEAAKAVAATLRAMGPHFSEIERLWAQLEELRQFGSDLPIVPAAVVTEYIPKFRKECSSRFGVRV